MIRFSVLCGVLAVTAWAQDLPNLSLTTGAWTCTEQARLVDGVAVLVGDPEGYTRVIQTVPAEGLAGRTIRFAADVRTLGMKSSRDIVYASPKLKIIDAANMRVMAVNNVGTDERPEWTPVYLTLTVPERHDTPITFELGAQLVSGTMEVRNVSIREVEPWRWRVLDAGHKSYFDR